MIAFLRGKLSFIGDDSVWLDVNGVGYEINVHQRTLGQMQRLGAECTLYTYMSVQENESKLYGFLYKEELNLFKLLIAISGIGSKVAQSIVAVMSPVQFYQAILSGDEKRLLSIPGIGKKMAGRLVFELKDRLSKVNLEVAGDNTESGSHTAELLEALEALGYSRSEVFPVVMNLQGELTDKVEENLKLTLKRLAARNLK
jgi:Holliday junction DNA helicase RuvA